MSEVLELVLDLVLNVIGSLVEVWLGDFTSADTTGNRILWCIILVLLGGLLWYELR